MKDAYTKSGIDIDQHKKAIPELVALLRTDVDERLRQRAIKDIIFMACQSDENIAKSCGYSLQKIIDDRRNHYYRENNYFIKEEL
jgi:hypothetical protein